MALDLCSMRPSRCAVAALLVASALFVTTLLPDAYWARYTGLESTMHWIAANRDLLAPVGPEFLDQVTFLNSRLPDEPPTTPQSSDAPLCIGITIFLRNQPLVINLLHSLVQDRLHAEAAASRYSRHHPHQDSQHTARVHVPWSLTVFWLPSDPAPDAIESHFVTRELQQRGVHVVRIDTGIAALRKRAVGVSSPISHSRAFNVSVDGADSAMLAELNAWVMQEGLTVPQGHNQREKRLVTPPHAYGFALDTMRSRQRACSAYVMIEDDVVAASGWEQELRRQLDEVSRADPMWRQLKLFTSNEHEQLSNFALFSVFVTVLGIAVIAYFRQQLLRLCQRLRTAGQLLPPALASTKDVHADRGAAVITLCALTILAATCAYFVAVLQLARIPCPLNGRACPGLRHLNHHAYRALILTQAIAYSPRTAASFAACMSLAPIPRDDSPVCWQVDLAMWRCLAASDDVYAGYVSDTFPSAGFNVERRAAEANGTGLDGFVPLPLLDPGRNHECTWPAVLPTWHGLYEAVPNLFQHVGLFNSFGQARQLLVSDYVLGRYPRFPQPELHQWPDRVAASRKEEPMRDVNVDHIRPRRIMGA